MFRVMLLAIFAPLIMFCLAFNWGRGMGATATKTLFASLLIIFACTASMSMLIYGAQVIASEFNFQDNELNLELIWPQVFILGMLGWVGIAFMLDAVGIANSLAGSVLSNLGAGMITGGMATMAATALKLGKGPMGGTARLAAHGLGMAGSNASSQLGDGKMGSRLEQFRKIVAGGR